MRADRLRRTPPVLLGLGVFAALVWLLCRGVFDHEDPPKFLQETRRGPVVELGHGFADPGVYQISDGSSFLDVIKMTQVGMVRQPALASGCTEQPVDGMRLNLSVDSKKAMKIQCGWMPASHRVALGIALHPDRMTRRDWMTLPGLGEKMAARIESDRQKNGDFGRIEALVRVKGIGEKRIAAWAKFF